MTSTVYLLGAEVCPKYCTVNSIEQPVLGNWLFLHWLLFILAHHGTSHLLVTKLSGCRLLCEEVELPALVQC